MEQLLAQEQDIDERDAFGTPLHHAAARGHTAVVKLLLTEGADVNVVARDGRVPLHWAAFKGRTAVVEMLLAAGARLDVENPTGMPLHLAAQAGHTTVVEMLLAAGADPNAKMSFGRQNAPLHLAASEGHADAAELLIEHGADGRVANTFVYTPLHSAVLAGRLEAAKLLIERGADVNAITAYGITPLHLGGRERWQGTGRNPPGERGERRHGSGSCARPRDATGLGRNAMAISKLLTCCGNTKRQSRLRSCRFALSSDPAMSTPGSGPAQDQGAGAGRAPAEIARELNVLVLAAPDLAVERGPAQMLMP